MAKKTKEQLLAFYSTQEGLHKINTVKNGLLNNSIESFPQIFATIAPSNLQTLLGKEFYAFGKIINEPGGFTLNEIEVMSSFFKVDFEVMYRFVRKAMIDEQKKNKRRKNR
jgi:hypothetical protein